MGRSEWGFLITSQRDVEKVLNMIKLHNESDMGGEDLYYYSVIKFENKLYLCVGNGGGCSRTSDFLITNYKGFIYYPHNKPDTWDECEDYIWKRKSEKDLPPMEIF